MNFSGILWKGCKMPKQENSEKTDKRIKKSYPRQIPIIPLVAECVPLSFVLIAIISH